MNTLPAFTRRINEVITDVRPFAAPLTDKERKGLHTMGEGREGIVRLVSGIATQHEQSLAREGNPNDLVEMLLADEKPQES